ncbi:MAG: helix-turn-helix domain-containing protein, partial [Bacteroidota bacterium]|nr:helix-turn-helix domain-containing protein [Bacteroidota bacterium]
MITFLKNSIIISTFGQMKFNKRKKMENQSVEREIEGLKQNMHIMNNLLKLILEKVDCNEVIGTKVEAAKFIGYDEQTITSLLDEGRIKNYGRGRIFIFHKSELLDIRK